MPFTREQNRILEEAMIDPSYQDHCNANYGPEDIPEPENHRNPRLPVKPWNMQSAIEQIQKCHFECEGGPLQNNDAWRWIVMTYGTKEPRTAAGSLD